MSDKNIQLIPVAKAAEEFGVNRQTIINWHDAGLLQGTTIKGNRFVTRESLDKLLTIYPEAPADDSVILSYKQQVETEREGLKEELNNLKTERIYRGYAPRYIHNFIDNAVGLIKIVDESCTDELLDDQFIRCWFFGHDIQQTCKDNGVSHFYYLKSVRRYLSTIRRLQNYAALVQENRSMKAELEEVKTQLQQLQADMDEYRARYERVDNEQTWKEKYPFLTVPVSELNFTVRTLNILKMHGFDTLAQVIGHAPDQLLKLRHFGRKSLTEIKGLLEMYGLELGMDLDISPDYYKL